MKRKEMERIANQYGLQYQKTYRSWLGNMEGYPIVISGVYTRGICTIKIAATIHLDEEEIHQWYKQFSSIDNIQNQEGSFEVVLKKNCTNRDKESIILHVLAYIDHELHKHPTTSCCTYCGMRDTVRLYGVYDRIMMMCDHCYKKLYHQIEVDHVPLQQYSNIGKGLLGAIIGTLLGVILWFSLYQMGFFAPIAGAVIAFGVWKGYTLFGGKISKVSMVLVILIMVLTILLSQVLCLAWSIYDILQSDHTFTFMKAFQHVGEYLQMDSIRYSFIRDISIGYLIVGLATYTLFMLHQKNEQVLVDIECLEEDTIER